MKEAIIIGASAAGISAGIYLKRRGIDFLILAKDLGGEMALSGVVENYPGIPETNGIELVKKFEEHAKKYDIEIKLYYTVKSLKEKDGYFEIEAGSENGQKEIFQGKALIIATGSSPKNLNIPGEKEFYHKGLSYCTVCDGPLFKGKTVAIIGGGNSALEAGLMMADLSPKVYLINKNEDFRGDEILKKKIKEKKNVEIINLALTQEIFGDEFVKGLKYLDLKTNEIKTINVDGIFVHIGLKPNTDFVPDEWRIKNTYGEIVVNKLCQTAKQGVFAAGDVTDIPYKQIGIAVGQGIIAALEVVRYLNSSE
jgi:thioredoxin-disulfide reductase